MNYTNGSIQCIPQFTLCATHVHVTSIMNTQRAFCMYNTYYGYRTEER